MHTQNSHRYQSQFPTTGSGRRLLAAGVVFSLLLMGSMATLTAGAEESEDPETYDTIQEALDAAGEGDTVVARASSQTDNPTPYLEALTINTDGVTLCSASPVGGSDPGPVFIGTPDDCEPGFQQSAVIDASTKGTAVVNIQADDVTVKGFTLRWVVSPERVPGAGISNPADVINQVTGLEGGVRGIVADGDDIRVEDNEIRIRVGPSPFLASSPSPMPGTGVVIPGGAERTEIVDNDIRVIRGEEGTIGGTWGIVASGEDYTIEGNTIKQWAYAGILVTGVDGVAGQIIDNNVKENGLYGLHLDRIDDPDAVPSIQENTFWTNGDAAVFVDRSHGAVIADNAIQSGLAAGSGVWVRGADDVELRGNIFGPIPSTGGQQTGFPVKVSGGPEEFPGIAPEGLLLRENHFRLETTSVNQFALHVTSDVQMSHIDARFNDWDACDWGDVAARVLDAGVTNTIDVTPFQTTDC